jgi:hypothetical protein
MKKIMNALALTLVLVGCAQTAKQAIQPAPIGNSVSEVTQSRDIEKNVWNQLSEASKKDIVGSWENAKNEKVIIQNHAFQNAEKYKGKELLQISFESRHNPTLGPVTVFVDPKTQKIVGYGLRD